MNDDRWVPVRILNTADKAVTLKRHTKVADVSTCIAIEDLDMIPEAMPAAEVKVQNKTICDELAQNITVQLSAV